MLHQCLDSVSQYIRLAQGSVFDLGTCDLPNRFDVFDLLQRSHDLWRVFKHVGLHGRGAPVASLHCGTQLGYFLGAPEFCFVGRATHGSTARLFAYATRSRLVQPDAKCDLYRGAGDHTNHFGVCLRLGQLTKFSGAATKKPALGKTVFCLADRRLAQRQIFGHGQPRYAYPS